MSWALAIHGGAGLIRPDQLSEDKQARALIGLGEALSAGEAVLSRGGKALEAVQVAILELERCEVFNASRGSVIGADGDVAMDAALMTSDSRFGGVANLRTTRHPILAARRVLDLGRHALLSGVDAWAEKQGLEQVDPEWLKLPSRVTQWRRAVADGTGPMLDHDTRGTVGAVARDVDGGFAAGNSTGGMVDKQVGRIGDSAVPGAGTWADTRCAIAATGDGERFLRAAFAHRVAADLRHGVPLEQACHDALEAVATLGGTGGCVAVDAHHLIVPFNSGGMYRGRVTPERRQLAIF